MSSSYRVLVVPTNRPQGFLSFLEAWEGRGGWNELYLIEDAPERTFAPPPSQVARHYSHREIASVLGSDSWIISRRDSAIRCFGLFMAWAAGATHVLTLDDDVVPHYPDGPQTPRLFDRHVAALHCFPRWLSTVPGLHVRGLPYRNRGVRKDVAISVGLWSGVPDLDGRTQLAEGVPPDFCPPPGNRLMAKGEYTTLCGMNLCLARRALPLAYFPLMGEGSPYRRYDDVWMGVIAKKICDHLGWQVSVGEPFVRHARASDPHKNAEAEAPGMEENETFWGLVDACPLRTHDAAGGMMEMGQHFTRSGTTDYHVRLGRALAVWAGLFGGRG